MKKDNLLVHFSPPFWRVRKWAIWKRVIATIFLTATMASASAYSYPVTDNEVVSEKISQQPGRQQPVKINGKITDETGESMVGASVSIEGTAIGSMADSNGNYTLQFEPSDNTIIVFSFLGKKSQRVLYKGQQVINIVLEEDAIAMKDVVITGVFNKARESYTGAVTTITKSDLNAAGNRSLITSIRNIDPSFNIVDNVNIGSDPNQLPDITLRGRTAFGANVRDLQEQSEATGSSNLPLFILDGFEVTLQRVMDMDDEQIESVTLLKDASATALYGSRGANGIVVITTKLPEAGKLRISYSFGLNMETPDLNSYNLMDAREKLEYERLAGLYTNTNSLELNQRYQELYNSRLIDVERGVDTYWLKYPVHTGVGQKHSLQMDGGTDEFRYGVNLGYNDIAGVMKGSSRDIFSGNVYLMYTLKNVKFNNDLTLSFTNYDNSPYGAFSQYAAINQYYYPYADDGSLRKMLNTEVVETGIPPRVGNPLWNANLPSRDNGQYTNIKNNFSIEWQIISGLSMRGSFGVTKQDTRTDKYLSRENTAFDAYSGDDYARKGSYTYGTGYLLSYEGKITLNYNKTFDKVHLLYVGLNGNMAEDKNETYRIVAEGFTALNMYNLGMAGSYAKDGKPYGYDERSRRVGGILNANYTYDQRYFVDFAGTLEGSSKFGANKRTAPFWSAGIGWNLHHENFMKDVKAVNSLRLRLSYGTSGSQNFYAYQALMTYKYYTPQYYKLWNGAYLMNMGNDDLGWQTTKQLNVGLETSLFNDRIKLNFDFYNKNTSNALADINLPTASGFISYLANIAEVRNNGVELTANAFIIQDKNTGITWSVGGSLAQNKNKILKISNSLDYLNSELMADEYNPSFPFKVGQSMNTIFAVKSLGIDPANGNEIYLDRNGNRTYVYNTEDKVACGVSDPKVWGNLRTMLRWKNVSLNLVFGYTLGGYIYNSTLVNKIENISAWENVDRRALYDRWTQPGDNAYFKRVDDISAQTRATSRFVMKENTLEMRTVNLDYEFDRKWLEDKIGLKYLKLSFYTEDVFRVSSIKRERGTDYPFSHKFSFGLMTRF